MAPHRLLAAATAATMAVMTLGPGGAHAAVVCSGVPHSADDRREFMMMTQCDGDSLNPGYLGDRELLSRRLGGGNNFGCSYRGDGAAIMVSSNCPQDVATLQSRLGLYPQFACAPGALGPQGQAVWQSILAVNCSGSRTGRLVNDLINCALPGSVLDAATGQCNCAAAPDVISGCACPAGRAGMTCDVDRGFCSNSGDPSYDPLGNRFECRCDPSSAGDRCQYSDGSCGGHGVVRTDGMCSCDPDFAGPACQYTREAQCNNVGAVDVHGVCTCDPGHAGLNCEFSDAVDCNNLGAVDGDGACACHPGRGGFSCEFTDAADCSGRGSVDVSPTGALGCRCDRGARGFYCQYTNADSCSGNGEVTALGICNCDIGVNGNRCEFSDAVTCNSQGQAQIDGSCLCFAPTEYGGDQCQCFWADMNNVFRCSSCVAGYAGEACQYSVKRTCNDRGVPQNDGSCVCRAGFAGLYCEHSRSERCQDHGTPLDDGSCACDRFWPGCSCPAGSNGTGCTFTDLLDCGGHGAAQEDGSCICDTGRQGPSCQYSDEETCAGGGQVSSDGRCACRFNFFAGDRCQCLLPVVDGRCFRCAARFGGPDCSLSADNTCQGRGAPRADGSCNCDSGYAGPTCQFSDNATCFSHGQAQHDGNCICHPGYAASAHCEHWDCGSRDGVAIGTESAEAGGFGLEASRCVCSEQFWTGGRCECFRQDQTPVGVCDRCADGYCIAATEGGCLPASPPGMTEPSLVGPCVRDCRTSHNQSVSGHNCECVLRGQGNRGGCVSCTAGFTLTRRLGYPDECTVNMRSPAAVEVYYAALRVNAWPGYTESPCTQTGCPDPADERVVVTTPSTSTASTRTATTPIDATVGVTDVPAGSSSSEAMGTGTRIVMIVFIAVIFTVAVVVWLVYCHGGRSRQQGKMPPPQQHQQYLSQMAHVGPGMGDQPTLPTLAPLPPPQQQAMTDQSMDMGDVAMVGPPSMSSTMIAPLSPATLQMAAGYSPLVGPMSPFGAQHGSLLNQSAMTNINMSLANPTYEPLPNYSSVFGSMTQPVAGFPRDEKRA